MGDTTGTGTGAEGTGDDGEGTVIGTETTLRELTEKGSFTTAALSVGRGTVCSLKVFVRYKHLKKIHYVMTNT
jgi:hypothetical protein